MAIREKYQIVEASDDIRRSVIEQLLASNLPVEDLDAEKRLYALLYNNEIRGTGGLEFFGKTALLRSISTNSSYRREGLGSLIVAHLEDEAKKAGAEALYLLTTTAKDFFARLGYQTITRENVDPAVQASSEFSSLCPATATIMIKRL
jgi:amino-acid N-acetyltransferase